MAEKQIYKIKLLILYEILRKNSDEQHKLTTQQLIAMLKERGINCDRKILYNDIATLNEYGFEIMTDRHKTSEYYVLDRDFDDSELRILMDAVQAASFISREKTKKLINKIAALSGDNRALLLKKTIRSIAGYKTDKNTFYDVETILSAILDKKLIKFKYFHYAPNGDRIYAKEGKQYTMLPLDMKIVNNDYYLITYHLVRKNTVVYKINRMDSVQICNDQYELDEKYDEAIKMLEKNAFSMYIGEEHVVSLIYNKNISSQVYEKFGKHYYEQVDENHYRSKVPVDLTPPFYAWCATFKGELKIESPKKAIDEYRMQLLACLGEKKN